MDKESIKEVRIAMKSNAELAAHTMRKALNGLELGANENRIDPIANQFYIDRLKCLKELIINDTKIFVAEIDSVIEKLKG